MKRKTGYLEKLLETENQQVSRLHEIVQKSIEEELLLSQELKKREAEITLTFGERLADRVATFGGSWPFIGWFFFVILLWMTSNVLGLFGRFDPYPFILLNLILSCLAAIQAPIIMMSQNRKEVKDRKRAENDYLINLKAELEIRNLHEKIDLSIVDQFKHLCDIQQKQLELLNEIKASTRHKQP